MKLSRNILSTMLIVSRLNSVQNMHNLYRLLLFSHQFSNSDLAWSGVIVPEGQ